MTAPGYLPAPHWHRSVTNPENGWWCNHPQCSQTPPMPMRPPPREYRATKLTAAIIFWILIAIFIGGPVLFCTLFYLHNTFQETF